MSDYLLPLFQSMQKAAQPNEAVSMRKYMKNQFDFLGVRAPLRKDLTKDFLQTYGLPTPEALHLVIQYLWQQPQREYQYVALEFYAKFAKSPTDDYLYHAEKLIISKSWWDTIDFIAVHIVGEWLKYHQKNGSEAAITDRWIVHENLWLRRTALLFQLQYKQATQEEKLFRYIEICKAEQNFFIKKAIGWALREYSKTNPMAVQQFIANTTLTNLSRKEGLKWLEKKKTI